MGANVGRTVINGERLGGDDPRDRYFLGAQFARDLREIALRRYRDLYRTYGRRSALYAEMVVGNTFNVTRMMAEIPQTEIYAMRVPKAVTLAEITKKTGLSTDEVKRFNPALIRRVPATANLYLPMYVAEFGPDVSFWHRPADPEFLAVLDDFVRLDAVEQAVVRAFVRANAAVVSSAVCGDGHRRRHHHGDDARLRDVRCPPKPPRADSRGVPGQRKDPAALPARSA